MTQVADCITKALEGLRATAGDRVYLSIRPTDRPTPAIVVDITHGQRSDMGGAVMTDGSSWHLECRCVADQATEAAVLAEQCIAAFNAGANAHFHLREYDLSTEMALPDDGQEDAERLVIVNLNLIRRHP